MIYISSGSYSRPVMHTQRKKERAIGYRKRENTTAYLAPLFMGKAPRK